VAVDSGVPALQEEESVIERARMRPLVRPIITLTTDFGLEDPFVGAMKGVILSIAPEVTIVDLTHHIPSHDILEAALVLRSSYSYFPHGSIHLVVVDPGVGSTRRPILVVTEKYFLVGPDNGILSLIQELENPTEIFHLSNQKYFLSPVSSTFHGRDIFSPVAAWICRGIPPEQLGTSVGDLVRLSLPRVRREDERTIVGTILRTDRFGNLVTNICTQDLCLPERDSISSSFAIEIGGRTITQLLSCYAEASPGAVFAIWGSSGLLEISVNQASAAEILQARRNQEFKVKLGS
jgi:S-adenosylmethionine hydrolase